MGRQINFWMAKKDEMEFLNILKSEDVLWSHRGIGPDEKPILKELSSIPINGSGDTFIIIKKSQQAQLKFKHILEDPLPHHGENFKPWTMVGCYDSPCFQWLTCKRENQSISRGRIYLETSWYNKKRHLVISKNSELISWFDKLRRKLRKIGIEKSKGQYIMPHAHELFKQENVDLKI